MANEEHVAILKQGVGVWNKWRGEHPEIRPDLRSAYLRNADLSNADLSNADLNNADLNHAEVRHANLREADLREADLRLADLSYADLRQANLGNANINSANIDIERFSRVTLSAATLREVDLSYADLRQANLNGANLLQANLRSAGLSQANLRGTTLSMADLSGADLSSADLSGADLREADLSSADLSEADLSYADLGAAHFNYATLRQANLSSADLFQADLSQADLSQAIIGWTRFDSVDLSEVKGLDTATYSGPSTIGVDTIYKSKGDIPEVFLRGAGVSDVFITYMQSLIGAAMEYYSCFISYSTKDQAFAERLHADLQAKGVRCWFAPHDIQSGKKIHEQIDQAIRVYDKLLLVLSESSMRSQWVDTEIYKARQRETEEKRRMLFPISLVEYDTVKRWQAFDADSGKDMGREVREYFIPDFTHWKDHDAYQKAFDRLLRDLKAPV